MRVKKRNGSVEEFKLSKVRAGIVHAFSEDGSDLGLDVINTICRSIERSVASMKGDMVESSELGMLVEQMLMKSGWSDAARRFILYRGIKEETWLKPDPEILSEYIIRAKYARQILVGVEPENSMPQSPGLLVWRRESWDEIVDRVFNMHQRKLAELDFDIDTRAEVDALLHQCRESVREKRLLPSMRSMQFGGAAIEDRPARMYNCCFTHIDRPEVFGEIMYLLLCGCGVGFSVYLDLIERLPEVKTVDTGKVIHHTIADTIEGWAEAVSALMESYWQGYHVEFNYSKIRPSGSRLVTSGGLAPGHIPLKVALENIKDVLATAVGRRLRPIECFDIVCRIAEAVLSGGIRRSALICLFDSSDLEMMYAKSPGNYEPGVTRCWRGYANISACLYRLRSEKSVFERILRLASTGYGEPGFYFASKWDVGCNPCGEITIDPVLYSEEFGAPDVVANRVSGVGFCNLVEINAAKVESKDDMVEMCEQATFLAMVQGLYTGFRFLGDTSRLIAERDNLIGVSITGLMDSSVLGPDSSDVEQILRAGSGFVKEFSKRFAGWLGVNVPKRACCIKPSGTASLVLGVSSGIHPHHHDHYIRRVIRDKGVGDLYAAKNPHLVEEGLWMCFPVEGVGRTLDSWPAIAFLEWVKMVYGSWVNPHDSEVAHNVSVTVTMSDSEVSGVRDWVWENRLSIGSLSFAPRGIESRYPHPPRESIDNMNRWNKLVRGYRMPDWDTFVEDTQGRMFEPTCTSDKCIIKN